MVASCRLLHEGSRCANASPAAAHATAGRHGRADGAYLIACRLIRACCNRRLGRASKSSPTEEGPAFGSAPKHWLVCCSSACSTCPAAVSGGAGCSRAVDCSSTVPIGFARHIFARICIEAQSPRGANATAGSIGQRWRRLTVLFCGVTCNMCERANAVPVLASSFQPRSHPMATLVTNTRTPSGLFIACCDRLSRNPRFRRSTPSI